MNDSGSGPRDDPAPLLPDNWEELAPLVDAVLDAPPELRAVVLDDVSRGDPERRAALERLVAECEQAMPLLERPAAERFAELVAEADEMPLTGLLGGRYEIGRELGRGGMARVYLARDAKHERDVAVKVIRQELAASLGRERFLREIAIAARLRHPNIVPLYDSGDADGVLYFVMPYEDGQSLRERLEGGSLSIAESMSVLRDVARALAYAHDHGVVHRDVKPDNVMLSGGATVVTDFGIAKAVSVAHGNASSSTLTQLGAGIGTPAYMSPEQAVGDPSTDHRADIYSFGCLAYEVFTGKPPFHGMASHQIIAAHVGKVAPLMTEVRTDVPGAVCTLVARCLEKDPASRPQSAREVLAALDEFAATTSAGLRSTSQAVVEPRNPRRARVLWAAGALLAATIAAAGFIASRSFGMSPPITLAVLPFGNIAADTSVDFVAGGLADEVAVALAQVPGIQITSRSAARAYMGQLAPDVSEAGKKLKAEYVMTGVVRQERERWVLSTEVSRAKNAASIWSQRFNLGPEQQGGAVEAITGEVTAALRNLFPKSIAPRARVAVLHTTTNPEANRFYLRGQVKLNRRGQSVGESAELFRKAIHEDTLFARAYAGLSLALAFFPYFQGVPPWDVSNELLATAQRALLLDSTLAQPHVALGMAAEFEYQWDRAEAEFLTAIRIDAHDVEARIQYGRYLRFRNRFSESMRHALAARAEDPASSLVLGHVSYGYFLLHQMDSALVESRRALDNDPENMSSLGLGALVNLANNLPLEARRLALKTSPNFANVEYVIAKSGDTALARQRLRALDAMPHQPWMGESRRALAYLGLGDTASALSALERATDGKQIWAAGFGVFDPMYDPIRESPRFKALVRRIGLAR